MLNQSYHARTPYSRTGIRRRTNRL
ncbi:MAG: hypothetical protein HY584_03115 [Candidatus Omnitrophica bacterium]|nr:hypothetical protein [Candidatus Omnitrophota bacterium]